MKQQLFGLQRAHINKLLQQLKDDFSAEYTQLEIEIDRIKSENEQLERELAVRTTKQPAQIDGSDVLKLAHERIEKVLHYLEEKKVSEMEEVRKTYTERINKINQQIETLDVEIQSVEKLFSDMFEQFIHQMEHPNPYPFSSEMKPLFQHEQMSMNASEIASTNEAAVSTGVAEHENMQVSSVTTEQSAEQRMRAANSIADTIVHSESFPNSDSFWGDIEQWASTSSPSLQEEPVLVNHEFMQIDEVFEGKGTKSEEIHQKLSSTKTAEGTNQSNQVESSNNSNTYSDALLEQIDSIKTQYIVGKVAGQDLYDLNGNLIVSKNALITREAVERANQIGKLAELIVNMKLTGGVD